MDSIVSWMKKGRNVLCIFPADNWIGFCLNLVQRPAWMHSALLTHTPSSVSMGRNQTMQASGFASWLWDHFWLNGWRGRAAFPNSPFDNIKKILWENNVAVSVVFMCVYVCVCVTGVDLVGKREGRLANCSWAEESLQEEQTSIFPSVRTEQYTYKWLKVLDAVLKSPVISQKSNSSSMLMHISYTE